MTTGYRGLQEGFRGGLPRVQGLYGVTRGEKRLHRVARGYRMLQGITGDFRDYKGLQRVIRGYRAFQSAGSTYRGLQEVTKG